MGYSLSKLKAKGSGLVFAVILATYMMPTTVCMAAIYTNIIKFPILCGDFRIFYKIVLPLSKPIVATTAILSFSGAWGDFLWPYLVLKDTNVQTIMVKIFAMQGSTLYGINVVLLGITFAIIPPAIIFIIFQRKIMNGFTMSGIKG